MSTYTLPIRSIPLAEPYDVIVAGGGPSGCTAAAAAAREGARTLLVESSGALGGSGTNALVPAWCPFSDKEKVIYRGMAEVVLEQCKAGMSHVRREDVDWVPIDAERLKRVYDDLVIGSGAQVLFNTVLSSVEGDGEQIDTLVISNKRGLSALRAPVYIDCTGDADLAAWAGADFDKGNEKGDLMPATHCFVLCNVDDYAFRHRYLNGRALHPDLDKNSPMFQIVESGKYPLIRDGHICANLIGPGAVGFNAGHLWGVDNTDPGSVSKALVEGRKMAQQFRDALAEFCPEAFGNAFLVETGNQMGIRESRRIVGDYVLTLEDYMMRRSFPDEICRNSYFIDIHQTKQDVAKNNAARNTGIFNPRHYGPGESHGVPFRCLIPKGLRNLLVAGRSISCERTVQGSVRVMPVCLAMGEAAGIAAACATIRHDGDVRAMDVNHLRSRLREEGGYLPDVEPSQTSANYRQPVTL